MTVYVKSPDHQFDPRVSEWMVATQTALWGAVLLMPQDTYSTSPTFNILKLFVPENTLGTILLVLGISRLVGLFINGRRRKVTPWVRLVSALCGFMIFTFISTSFALSGVISTWIAIYPVIAAVEFINVYRSAHDAGKSIASSS